MMQATFFTFLFFLSGFAGLVYESIWSQYLKLFLGHAAYAQALVLCIYMGGMAVGAWVSGRFINTSKTVLSKFAGIEICLGCAALVFHPLFLQYQHTSFTRVLPFLENSLLIWLYKWLSSSLLILPQSMLLGATFPFMTAGFINRCKTASGYSISILYFANSFGAAVGVLIGGFLLIGKIGLHGTLATAGIIDIFVGSAVLIFIKFVRKEKSDTETISPIPLQLSPATENGGKKSSSVFQVLMVIAGLTALSSFMYEIGWIRMLSLVLGSSTHSFELMLSTFIFGIALGSFFIRNKIDRIPIPKALILSQALMGAASLMSILFYSHMFYFMRFVMSGLKNNNAGYLFFNGAGDLICMIIMLPATICAGMVLPLILHFFYRNGAGEQHIAKIYSINTFGSIAGVLLALGIILPLAGVRSVVTLGGILDLGIAFYLLKAFDYTPHGYLRRFLPAFSIVFIVISVSFGRTDPALAASGVFRNGTITRDMRMISHKDGRTATVSLYKNRNNIVLSTNGKPDAAINIKGGICGDEYTMSLLGVLPMAMTRDSCTAAVIGLGSGMTVHYLLHDSTLRSVDIIEIEPEMAKAARKIGHKVEKTFCDKRSVLHIDDAKTFFSLNNRKFDIVISEPSNPWVSGVAGLFTREFFGHVKNHLAENGILVQWFHRYESDITIMTSIFGALNEHFPSCLVFSAGTDCIIIASKDPSRSPDFNRDIFRYPDLSRLMNQLGFYSLDDFKALRLGSERTMKQLLNVYPSPPNSDYFPYVDLNAVRFRYLDESISEIDTLIRYIVPVRKIIESDTGVIHLSSHDTMADLSNLSPYYEAKSLFRELTEKIPCTPNADTEYTSLALLFDYFTSSSSCISFNMVFGTIIELLQKTLPWLSRSEMQTVWETVAEKCMQYVTTEDELEWMIYFQALCNYDFHSLEKSSAALLPSTGPIDDDYVNRMLLTSLSIACSYNGNRSDDQFFYRFSGRKYPGVLLTISRNWQPD